MKKVIIIGAGPAGLTAANELLRDSGEEYEIVILEESDAIGGISQTVRYNGNRDLGEPTLRVLTYTDSGMLKLSASASA